MNMIWYDIELRDIMGFSTERNLVQNSRIRSLAAVADGSHCSLGEDSLTLQPFGVVAATATMNHAVTLEDLDCKIVRGMKFGTPPTKKKNSVWAAATTSSHHFFACGKAEAGPAEL